MQDKIERQKIFERDNFTREEKSVIADKSDDRCCHCGKKCLTGDTTIDHFIPLSEGGTNRDINLIMLCEDCNREKGNKIIEPNGYLKYLKPEHKEKLVGYFESYTQSFEYVSRRNILACDEYTVPVYIASCGFRSKGGKRKSIENTNAEHTLKKATFDDFHKIFDYYLSVLKKYEKLDDVGSAEKNILFWMTFGCIYYIERNNQVKTMVAVTLQDQMDDKSSLRAGVNKQFVFYFFSYYNNAASYTLTHALMDRIPSYIADEQGLKVLPCKYVFLDTDPLGVKILSDENLTINKEGEFLTNYSILRLKECWGIKPIEEENLQKFFQKFKDVEEEMLYWMVRNNGDDVKWMMDDVIYGINRRVNKDG